jgi:hypothetical protein
MSVGVRVTILVGVVVVIVITHEVFLLMIEYETKAGVEVDEKPLGNRPYITV